MDKVFVKLSGTLAPFLKKRWKAQYLERMVCISFTVLFIFLLNLTDSLNNIHQYIWPIFFFQHDFIGVILSGHIYLTMCRSFICLSLPHPHKNYLTFLPTFPFLMNFSECTEVLTVMFHS